MDFGCLRFARFALARLFIAWICMPGTQAIRRDRQELEALRGKVTRYYRMATADVEKIVEKIVLDALLGPRPMTAPAGHRRHTASNPSNRRLRQAADHYHRIELRTIHRPGHCRPQLGSDLPAVRRQGPWPARRLVPTKLKSPNERAICHRFVIEGSSVRGVQSTAVNTGIEYQVKRDGGYTAADVGSIVRRRRPDQRG
jgi:hypothetical protein